MGTGWTRCIGGKAGHAGRGGVAPRSTSFVMLNSVQHPWNAISRAREASVAPWALNQVQGDGGRERTRSVDLLGGPSPLILRCDGSVPLDSFDIFVMLNSFQHPWSAISRARGAGVAPWTLNQVQGDGRRRNQECWSPSVVAADPAIIMVDRFPLIPPRARATWRSC